MSSSLNKTDLYSLPKDMLVQVISTVQEQTENAWNAKLVEEQQKRHNLLHDLASEGIIKFKQCSKCEIYNYMRHGVIFEYSQDNIEVAICRRCKNAFCEMHMGEYDSSKCCKKCYQHIDNQIPKAQDENASIAVIEFTHPVTGELMFREQQYGFLIEQTIDGNIRAKEIVDSVNGLIRRLNANEKAIAQRMNICVYN